ncbi:hypothetical protein [Alistipes sp.]|uniref:hypothetical protein n=1 Tax=Alistipes sp. TaxID=1872444 RepID=UPI003AF13E83
MKSTRAKAYIDESLSLEIPGGYGVSQEDTIRAVEIAECDLLQEHCDRHRSDRQFLEEMLERFDRGESSYVRQQMTDWIEELERKVVEMKRLIDN